MFKFSVDKKNRDKNYLEGYKENEKIKPSDELIKIMSVMVLGSNK